MVLHCYQSEAHAIVHVMQRGMGIARIGEVGLTSKEIQSFENKGDVLRGSRHSIATGCILQKHNDSS